jgi:peptidoglycan hydrolase-like protein with peptidoglycan-binding domain
MKLKRILVLKTTGDDVKFAQTLLKKHGFFKDRIDGYFGQNTLVSVTNFQKTVGSKIDGVIGPLTWNKLLNYSTEPKIEDLINQKPVINSILEKPSFVGQDGLKIFDCLLKDDEYYKEETPKNTIWLHHTAGGSRPDWTIGGWEKDFKKDKSGNPVLNVEGKPVSLKVGTQFVIGRRSSSTDDTTWDGVILRAFEEKFWSYHLGINYENSKFLNSSSIGIEICNYGPLTLKDGRFYNYVNSSLQSSVGVYNPVMNTSAPGMIACCGAFDGYLSIVRVYNRALTPTEITQNWNAQKSYFGL